MVYIFPVASAENYL